MTIDPRSYNYPDRKTLESADIPGLGDAVLVLAREVWVLTDRLAVMQAVLAKRGIDIADEIDAFQPDEALQAELNEKGQKLLAEITNAIAGIKSGNATD